jgi:hypothetical protein
VLGQVLTEEPINDPGIFFSFAPKPVTYLLTSGKNKGNRRRQSRDANQESSSTDAQTVIPNDRPDVWRYPQRRATFFTV